MRKNLGSKPCLYPEPVLIIGTYDENNNPNLMNAAWGGIADDNLISICLSPEHKTVKNLLNTKAFTVSIGEEDYVKECDFVGIVSGNNAQDKFKKTGFHAIKSNLINAPIIEELKMCLECKVISYDSQTCRLLGEIVNISIDDSVFDENGKVDVKKLKPLVYDPFNHVYLSLGNKVDDAFKAGKKLF